MLPTNREFQEYVSNNWSTLSKESRNQGRNPKQTSSRASSLYHNLLKSELPFVVIGAGVRNNEELTNNLGLVTSTPAKRKGKSEQDTRHLAGAILGENPWSLFINDVFMLGAIHSARDVHLALEDGNIPGIAALWDEKKKTFKPLGRELAILVACHYHRVEGKKSFGLVFAASCEDLDRNSTITISELRERISQVKKEGVKNLLKENSDRKKSNMIEILETDIY